MSCGADPTVRAGRTRAASHCEMPTDLSAITAKFPPGEWAETLAGTIRRAELDRIRAARIMHDEVGQLLTAASIHLALVASDGLTAGNAQSMSAIPDLLDRAMAQVREVTWLLNPSAAERIGLRLALEQLTLQKRPLFTGELTLEYPENLRVPTAAARALLAIAGPALDYAVIRGPKQITIRVNKKELGIILEVLYDIADLGKEPEANARTSLILMQFNAIGVGLRVVFEEAPAGSTIIRAVHGREPELDPNMQSEQK